MDHHPHHGTDHAAPTRAMALAATLHCLTGCAIGEVTGLVVGTATGLGSAPTIALSVALAFGFGFALSALPLLRTRLGVGAALGIVAAADTLSITTMEVVDNAVMATIPGAMDAGLADAVFWVGMTIALVAAGAAAYPVNRWLLGRGRGHALTHRYHQEDPVTDGWRRLVPAVATSTLTAALAAFLLGGLVAALAAPSGSETGEVHQPTTHQEAPHAHHHDDRHLATLA